MSDNRADVSQVNNAVLLSGLDGTNPLGFLAALGLFRVLSNDTTGLTMTWQLSNGTWRPSVSGIQVPLTEMGAELHAGIAKLDQSVWSFDKKLPFAATRLREEAQKAIRAASTANRSVVDDIASLGVECLADDDADFAVTALCMVRSGDSTGQGLLAYGKRIIETTTKEQLQQAVGSQWVHEDDKCALRWDPAEDRGYALQWRNPSKVGALSIKGGNCLALFGMSLFPTVPAGGLAETTAFGLKEPKKSSFTWPIWTHPISIDVVKSLIGMSELQRAQPARVSFGCRGIEAVYRCDRIMTSTYYANFTPARRLV
jgi:hypothetical protein